MVPLVKITLYIVILLLFSGCNSEPDADRSYDPLDYVDPMIGSVARTKFYGRTSPGVTLPFSLVKPGPDTHTGGDVGSGYSFEHETLEGFSFVHMSGVGWFGDFGNLLVTPSNETFHPNRGSHEDPDSGYRSRINHKTENAEAAYYSIHLDDYRIKAEVTTTQRAGILRFTFPEDSTNRIQIDLARRIGGTSVRQYIRVIDNQRIEGWIKCTPEGGGWGNGKTNMVFYTLYFSGEFSKPFHNHAIWTAEIPVNQGRKSEDVVSDRYQGMIERSSIHKDLDELEGAHLGFYASYPHLSDNEQVMFKAGISFVDLNGARNNLKEELDHWDFEQVVADGEKEWMEYLDLIKIDGASEEQKKIFYTALYHALNDPRDFTDHDGRFYLKETGSNGPEKFNYRSVFSGWDAFRSHMPLLTIIDPAGVSDLVHSLIFKGEKGSLGFPKWEIAGCYSNCMLGDPAIPVILDAWTKGIRDFDLERAYRIGIQTSLGPNTIRNGWEHYNNQGYVACDPVPERWNGLYKGVSATLENCYADWCLSEMAEILNDSEGIDLFSERAQNYHHLYDTDLGFFRGRFKDGSWIPWEGELVFRQGYIESNPLQQMWFVPHDIPGLKSLIGEERFLSELERLFDQTPKDFSYNEYYNHANEPVHHIPYLFNYTSKPWLTQKWVRIIMENAYGTTPYGIMGNEDVGQMSAWYILSALGFHPVCPGDQKYMLGSPLFPKVEIRLNPEYYNGDTFTIISTNNSSENVYVQEVYLNGKELKRPYIFHQEITRGGELVFEMGNSPNKDLYSENVAN